MNHVKQYGLAAAFLALTLWTFADEANASADPGSYLADIHSHSINVGMQNDAWLVASGLKACELFRAGVSLDQMAAGATWMDARGIAAAAQRDLCPETLGHANGVSYHTGGGTGDGPGDVRYCPETGGFVSIYHGACPSRRIGPYYPGGIEPNQGEDF